ncbi:MAG: FtsX-like permease family protein [Myxococcales bacterium]|nr:FtsX-like permease family protein [Myxococcales bacterium]
MSLERIIAARYLKRLQPRGVGIHLITVVIFGLAWVLRGVAYSIAQRAAGLRTADPSWLNSHEIESALETAALGGLVATVLFGFLVLLLRHFTIFTAISTFGLFLGSWALVVVLSVMSGFEQDLKQKILGANAHIIVTAPDHAFTDYPAVGEQVRLTSLGRVSPYISNEVMISSQSNLAGVIVKGIDPRSAAEATDLGKNLEQGSLDHLTHPERVRAMGFPDAPDEVEPPPEAFPPDSLRPADPKGHTILPRAPGRRILPGLIIGRELAKNLRLYLGDDVNVISPMGDIGPAGPMPKSRAFRVAGIFYSGMYEYDTKYVYMSISAAQKFLGTDDEITGLEVRLADADRTEPVVDKLRATLGPGFEVQDWKELNRNLFSALKVEKVAMFIFLHFIILVAGFSIVANGIMLVREKRREIAILKSMGASDRSVLTIFLHIGLYMGTIGILVGIATGVASCLLLGRFGIALDTDVYYISKLPVRLDPYEILAVFGGALTIVLGATLYPALVAAHLRPVDGLRYDQG